MSVNLPATIDCLVGNFKRISESQFIGHISGSITVNLVGGFQEKGEPDRKLLEGAVITSPVVDYSKFDVSGPVIDEPFIDLPFVDVPVMNEPVIDLSMAGKGMNEKIKTMVENIKQSVGKIDFKKISDSFSKKREAAGKAAIVAAKKIETFVVGSIKGISKIVSGAAKGIFSCVKGLGQKALGMTSKLLKKIKIPKKAKKEGRALAGLTGLIKKFSKGIKIPKIKFKKGESRGIKRASQKAEGKGMKKIKVSKDSAKEKFNEKLNALKSNILINVGVKYFKQGIDMAEEMDAMKRSLQHTLGDDKMGEKLFNHLQEKAKASSYSFKELKENSDKFLSTVENVGQLDSLNNMTERLSKIKGVDMGESSDALSGALSGDTGALTEKFNISSKDLESSGFDQLVSKGDTQGAIDALDKLLVKAGFTDKALGGMNGGIKTQMEMIKQTLSTSLGDGMRSTLEIVAPIFQKINELVQNGALQPFINFMVGGFNMVAEAISYISEPLLWLFEAITSNKELVYSLLTALVATFLPMLLMAIYQVIAAVVALVIANWPLLLVVGIIMILVYCFLKFGNVAETVGGIIGGVIGGIWAVVYNVIACVVNAFTFAGDFIKAVFKNPIAFIKMLFWQFVSGSLSGIAKLAKGVGWILSKITGKEVTIGSKLEEIKDLADQKAKEYSAEMKIEHSKGMDLKDIGAEYEKGKEKGKDIGKGIDDGIAKFADKVAGFAPDPSKDTMNEEDPLNPSVKVENGGNPLKVDMDNEEMTYLKDLAERDYIAKYNTSTLAPNIEIQFGDVKETADMDQVAGALEKILREQISVAAEGV